MKLRFALSITWAILAAATAPEQAQRFALAIVRLDGSIVPFAAYDEGRWERAWPAADEAIDSTPTIDGIPSIWRARDERVPRQWTVWPATGARPIQARVTGIQVADAHCNRRVVLKTDLRAVTVQHSPKIGVAVEPNVPMTVVERMNSSSPVWRAAEEVVISNFAKLESAEGRRGRQELPHDMPSPVAHMTALYRESSSSRPAMYFVAERKYRTPSSPQDPSCERITVMTGWLLPTADGGLMLADAKVFLTDCDEKDVRTDLPLAAVHISNRVFWVLQRHGYEDEAYVIAEIGPTDVRYPIEVNGGGC